MKLLSKTLAAVGVAALTAATLVPTTAALAASPPKFQNHGSYGTYNNYRGDRNRHPGYKNYGGFWFPPAAFVAGAVIGGLLTQPSYPSYPAYQTYSYAPNAHLAWCQQNYRSYNPATDTFRGYDGYDHRCVSPYDTGYGY